MKSTDYEKVFELARNILKDDKKMVELTEDLRVKLKALEGTFLDDGIEEVKDFVKGLSSQLNHAQESFFTIASELNEYGKKLKAGKG